VFPGGKPAREDELALLRGADEGLKGAGAQSGFWERSRHNGDRKERGSHRSALDMPTYLRKPVEDD
jgi:hypothetical protein